MKPEPTSTEVRRRLADLAAERGTTMAGLSRMILRPDSYLGRFVRQGVPARLQPDERDKLAAFFGVSARELGEWDNPDEQGRR